VRALRFRPELASGPPAARREGATVVWVVAQDGMLRDVAVMTGVRDAEWVEVLEGELHEGDRVATAYKRQPGSSVPGPATPPFGLRRL